VPQIKSIASDPRTIAREVAGVFDAVFPQLAPGIVAHFNRNHSRFIEGGTIIGPGILDRSTLQRAMLFELAVAIAEDQLQAPGNIGWEQCLARAGARQRRFFDANIPTLLTEEDRRVAAQVANNLLIGIAEIADGEDDEVIAMPRIPGYRWIATGEGDFATKGTIIEVKCSSKRFSSADYRQIVIYWLLKHIYSAEFGGLAWNNGVLINPRLCLLVEFPFKHLVELIAFDSSVISVTDKFASVITDRIEDRAGEIEHEIRSWPDA